MTEADKANGLADDAMGGLPGDSAVLANEPDGELSLLFSVFDDVYASNELKLQTLNRVLDSYELSSASVEKNETAACGEIDATECSASDEGNGSSAKEDEIFSAVLGGRPTAQNGEIGARQMRGSHRRSRFRVFRTVAVAACLALALVGGVTYAIPTSTVQLSQGSAVVELGVNRFGFVVSATSSDDLGREVVEKGGLLTSPYDDALVRVADGFGAPSSDQPFEAAASSYDVGQREGIEERNREFVAERNGSWNPDSDSDVGEPQGESSERRPEDQQPPVGGSTDAPDGSPAQAGQLSGERGNAQRGETDSQREEEGDLVNHPGEQVNGESDGSQPNVNKPGEQVSGERLDDGESGGDQSEVNHPLNVQSYSDQQGNKGQDGREQPETEQFATVE